MNSEALKKEGMIENHPDSRLEQEIILEANLDQRKLLRDFIHKLVSNAPGNREKLKDALDLIGHELFTNCLFHAGLDPHRDKIVFRGKLLDDGVWLECLDTGNSFDPKAVPFPDFSGDRGRGFGLYFIKQLSDSLTYFPKPLGGWNIFRIEKKYIVKEELPVTIYQEAHPEYFLVRLKMEYLDARTCPKVKEEIIPLVESFSTKQIIFDLSNVQFIDSSGFGTLIHLLKQCREKNTELYLYRLTPHAENCFKMLNLDKLFKVTDVLPPE